MSSPPDAKRLKTGGSRKTIGTHDGTFHCDEALAVFLLRLTEQYQDADLVRSRDPKILADCSVVVDVGAVYDAQAQRFDHHQKGFEEVFGHGFTTKLSSAGLVYKHFGEEILRTQMHRSATRTEDKTVSTLYLKLYKEFIEGIDGIDNGVSQFPSELEPAYRIRTDLSSRVGWLNPAWNEHCDREAIDNRFLEASALTGKEFLDRLTYYSKAWLPARDIVLSAVQSRHEFDAGGKIIVFEAFAPWKEHLFDIESELKITDEKLPYYVIYPDEAARNWRIQAVPQSSTSFTSRLALPESWRGLRDQVLSEKCGIPECIFVHASGFIGGNQTKDGALQMARNALQGEKT